jgi:hypothetical protein
LKNYQFKICAAQDYIIYRVNTSTGAGGLITQAALISVAVMGGD